MKDRNSSPVAVVLLLLAACLILTVTHAYCSDYVTIDGVRYEQTTTHLDLSGNPVEELDKLQELPGLVYLNLRGTGLTPEQYDVLHAQLPGCRILWDVPFQGSTYPNEKSNLTISTLSDADLVTLDYFTRLQYIYAEDCRDYDQLLALRQRRPECVVYYNVEIGDNVYNHRAAAITAPGDDLEGLSRLFPLLPGLKAVTLTAPLAEIEEIYAFREEYPELTITWALDIFGVPADESTTTLDLTGRQVGTVEAVESLLPYLPNLTYVDMSDCGISNEEMDALNRRYENIKFVWTVSIGAMRVKTDITWFMPVKYNVWVRTRDVYNLRYCTDIICLDIGHMKVDNCEFVAFMPHLKYLILADTPIRDITPLTGLTELIYLELFMTYVTDYTPLLTLTALEDLNIHYTRGDPEIIAQMTWLKRLWWGHNDTYRISYDDMLMLYEALPNTQCEFWTLASTGANWRDNQNYRDMRDILGMWYMK